MGAKRYRVIGALAVVRKDGNERYVANGGVFGADQIDEANAKHLRGVGLIEVIKEAAADPGTPEPYAGVTVVDLKAEIDKRNKDRAEDAKIAPAEPGNRPELVAALVADDAKS